MLRIDFNDDIFLGINIVGLMVGFVTLLVLFVTGTYILGAFITLCFICNIYCLALFEEEIDDVRNKNLLYVILALGCPLYLLIKVINSFIFKNNY